MAGLDVVLASGSEHLRESFLRHGCDVHCCNVNYDGKRIFPNADIYARLPDIADLSNKRVIVVQSCTGAGPAEIEPYTTSDRVVELLLILDILKNPYEVEETGHKMYRATQLDPPERVEVVLTFQPFALQDKAFKTGEAISARWATRAILEAADKMYVINPHAPESLDWVRELVERGVYEKIDLTHDLLEFASRRFGFSEYIAVSPDEGGQERFSMSGYGKSRHDSFTVELHGELDVKGRRVIVLDDLTKSGSTLLKAAERLRSQGAVDVGLAVAHVLPLVDKGEELLEDLYRKSEGKIVTSNSIRTRLFCDKHPENTYDVVDTIVRYL
ncbi:MAG: phosphoribosyltransferase family protein [Candidatus Thorarchaeota archaeon]